MNSNVQETVEFLPVKGISGYWHLLSFGVGVLAAMLGSILFISFHGAPKSLPMEANVSPENKLRLGLSLSWEGVLIIKDGEAVSVAHNKAALNGGGGFKKLSYGQYEILAYTVTKDGESGIGLAYGTANVGYFPVVWRKGKSPVPDRVAAVELVGGRKIIVHK